MNTLPIKILIVDDDEDDFFITKEYIERISHQRFVIDWCPLYADALHKMRNKEYSIYFVDYYLGARTGLQLLKEAIASDCEEPIVLLTGRSNHTMDIEAMQAGAYDYLVKPDLSTEKLERCIRYSMEKARTVKALRENERKFRSIFEKSKDMVFVADDNFIFRNVNPAAEALLEFTREELIQQNFFRRFSDVSSADMIRKQLETTGLADDIECDLLTKNNTIKNCILSIACEKDSNEKIYYQGIVHDISNLRKNEKSNLQLQKLAVAGRLVHTLAHEIRNPLNNITLSISQMIEEQQSPEPDMYLDIIHRNSIRIGDIIKELLNSSRPSEMEAKKKSLQGIMDESIAAALDRITLKRIDLSVSYATEELEILADAEKLKIAFLNIIINAIEAMEEENGKLKIVIRNSGQEHIVEISDNGCGISPENISHLFEPYFTSKRNGMGLGLASTLNILQSHKAFIDVQSAPGQGTTFILTFKHPID